MVQDIRWTKFLVRLTFHHLRKVSHFFSEEALPKEVTGNVVAFSVKQCQDLMGVWTFDGIYHC